MTGLISVPIFAGKLPILDPKLLPDGKGIKSENMRIGSGSMEPLKGLRDEGISLPVDSKTIWLANSQLQQWFSWAADVDVATSPIAEDAWERIYFTGDGAPQMTVPSIALQADAPRWPSASYRLGIPAPVAPLVAAKGTEPPEFDPDALEISVTYVVCYVSEYGEIGPPSPPSEIVARADGYPIDLSVLPAAPSGSHNITHKRIYRSSGGDYLFVKELPIATDTDTDVTLDESIGDPIPSITWDMPHEEMKGLLFLPNGVGVGFFNNVLCFSEPYLPHAWPVNYRLTTDKPIVSIQVTSQGISITTEGSPYICVGSTPGSMLLQDADIEQACISKESHVDMGEYTLYASPDGLVVAPSSQEQLATQTILSKEQWQALTPSSIRAVLYDGQYIAQHQTGAFIYNPKTEDITDLSEVWDASYYDPSSDTLYVLAAGQLKAFDKGDLLTAVYRTKQYLARPAGTFVWGQVEADSYPVTFDLYADGDLIHHQIVQDFNPFRVSVGDKPYRKVEIEIIANTRVSLLQSSTLADLLA